MAIPGCWGTDIISDRLSYHQRVGRCASGAFPQPNGRKQTGLDIRLNEQGEKDRRQPRSKVADQSFLLPSPSTASCPASYIITAFQTSATFSLETAGRKTPNSSLNSQDPVINQKSPDHRVPFALNQRSQTAPVEITHVTHRTTYL